MKRFQTYWNIFWHLRKMHLMILFERRADFLFWGFVSIMWTVFNFFFMHVLVNISGNIRGWDQHEFFVLQAIYTIFDAFTWSFFYFNMNRYVNRVFSGELDTFLLKPIDPQFILSVEHNSYNNLFRLFIGVGVLIVSVFQLPHFPSVFTILFSLTCLLLGFLLIYSLWFTIATISFWVDRLNNINEVLPSLRRVSQFPREMYKGAVSILFCSLFPIVLVTSIPSEIMVSRSSAPWVFYFIFASLSSFVFCRWFFHFSLRKYSGAGG